MELAKVPNSLQSYFALPDRSNRFLIDPYRKLTVPPGGVSLWGFPLELCNIIHAKTILNEKVEPFF